MPDKKEYIGGDRLTQVLGYIKGKLDGIGTSLNSKVDKVQGKDLSTNDFTDSYKTKLDGIGTGAQANVQSDWDENDSSNDAFVLHKPTKLSQFTNDIVTDNNPSLSWATKSKVATIGGIDINVTMPANPNTDTTYSLTRDGTSVKLTPSSGTAQSVSLDSLLTNLATWTATPTDDTYLIRRDTAGGAAYGQVKFSTVWTYIDSKVAAAGYTKNIGTVTQVKVGTTAYDPSSGVVSLPAYPDISTKVSKSGDTMSGNLTFSGSAGIQFQGTKSTYKMIAFKDNTSDTYGNGIVIGGGGLTIIGGGESASTVASQYSTGGSEDMVVAGDGNIYLLSNVNNGYSARKTFTFNTSGDLTVPRYVYANYFNSSAEAETPAADSYLIYANSDGWYRKSTIENIEAINGNYTAWIPVTTSPTAGWRRICKVTYGKKGYENGFLLISGGWNNGAPSSAIISICVRHNVASMLLIQNIATDGLIQQVRMVNVSGSTYWIDAYMKAQSNGVSEQYFKFYGNFEISEIQKSATIITDSVTEAANVSLTANTLKGTVVVSTATNGQEIYTSNTDTPVYLKGNATTGTFIGFKNSSNTIMGYFGVKSDNKPYFYSGSAKEIVTVTGATMTGQLKTSFKESVAMGSFAAASTTVATLCDELRYSSGCCGSVSLTAYTGSPSSVAGGWYNFLWIPHRSGGVNGAASGDNCNYGRLMLRGMTVNGEYEIRYASSGIQYCRELISAANIGSQSVNYATSAGSATSATKATQDGDGNAISSTYLKLSGGTMTGTIVTPKDDTKGLEPAANNWGRIGSSDKYYCYAYITSVTTNALLRKSASSDIGTSASPFNYAYISDVNISSNYSAINLSYLNSNYPRFYAYKSIAAGTGWRVGDSVTVNVTGLYFIIAWAVFTGTSGVEGVSIKYGGNTCNQNVVNMNYGQNITITTCAAINITSNTAIAPQAYSSVSQAITAHIVAFKIS